MGAMNPLDYFNLGVLVVFTAFGLYRGAVKQVILLLAVVAGMILAVGHHERVASLLPFGDETARLTAAFSGILFACILAGWIVGWLAGKLLKTVHLGWANRLLGGLIGALQGVLLVCVASVALVLYLPSGHNLVARSRTLPFVLQAVDAAGGLLGYDLREGIREKSRELKDAWRDAAR